MMMIIENELFARKILKTLFQQMVIFYDIVIIFGIITFSGFKTHCFHFVCVFHVVQCFGPLVLFINTFLSSSSLVVYILCDIHSLVCYT